MNGIDLFKDLVSKGIGVGDGVPAGPLTFFPLTHRLPPGDFLLYQLAHSLGLVAVEETSEAGTVGELRVINRASKPVLFLEGEVLLGMKQTRVLNKTILVAAASTLVVPVSCVEAGRWHRESEAAMGRDSVNLSPRVRSAKTMSTVRAALATGQYRSDQGEVWHQVAGVLADQEIDAPTGSYSEIARRKGSEMLDRAREIRPAEGQSGVLAYREGRPSCVDLFDGPATLSSVWDGLIASYLTDARPSVDTARRPSRAGATRWIHGLASGEVVSLPSLGVGESLSCLATRIEAAALMCEDRLLHLAAFPSHSPGARTSFAPPSQRR